MENHATKQSILTTPFLLAHEPLPCIFPRNSAGLVRPISWLCFWQHHLEQLQASFGFFPVRLPVGSQGTLAQMQFHLANEQISFAFEHWNHGATLGDFAVLMAQMRINLCFTCNVWQPWNIHASCWEDTCCRQSGTGVDLLVYFSRQHHQQTFSICHWNWKK